jgi:hypothetical protein
MRPGRPAFFVVFGGSRGDNRARDMRYESYLPQRDSEDKISWGKPVIVVFWDL